MAYVIEQSVEFQGTTAQELFDIYMTDEKHSAAISSPVTISAKVGGEFQAFGSGLRGIILEMVPGRLIVQSWRGQPWKKEDLDSVLVLSFHDTRHGARIDLVHVNIPDHAQDKVNADAWNDRYWHSWKAYLAERHRAQ